MSNHVSVNWDDILNKKARGIDADLGKVEAIATEHIITKKGILSRDRFYLPKKLVKRIDVDKIWLNVTENEAEVFKTSKE
jgi:hypothetical protein